MDVAADKLDKDQRLSASLRSPGTTSHQIVREESITEDIAIALTERFNKYTKLTLLTASEESIQGADWYWQIRVGTLAMHARVQAKRIRRSVFGEPDDQGTIELNTEQTMALLNYVENAQESLPSLQTWFAFFGRFNATPPCKKSPEKCLIHACGGACSGVNRLPSIWIAQASKFAHGTRRRQVIRMADIIGDSLRLDCFLPCISSNDGRGPRAKGFEVTSGIPTFESAVATIQSNDTLVGELRGALQIGV